MRGPEGWGFRAQGLGSRAPGCFCSCRFFSGVEERVQGFALEGLGLGGSEKLAIRGFLQGSESLVNSTSLRLAF